MLVSNGCLSRKNIKYNFFQNSSKWILFWRMRGSSDGTVMSPSLCITVIIWPAWQHRLVFQRMFAVCTANKSLSSLIEQILSISFFLLPVLLAFLVLCYTISDFFLPRALLFPSLLHIDDSQLLVSFLHRQLLSEGHDNCSCFRSGEMRYRKHTNYECLVV